MTYEVNKGIGGSVEFKGLKAQYLFIFVGGLVAVFILTVLLNVFGASMLFTTSFAIISGMTVVWGTYTMNKVYGEHGLMKQRARALLPDYLINRRSVRFILFNNNVRFKLDRNGGAFGKAVRR